MNKVHHSYLEYPCDEWLMSNNSGHCYKEQETREILTEEGCHTFSKIDFFGLLTTEQQATV